MNKTVVLKILLLLIVSMPVLAQSADEMTFYMYEGGKITSFYDDYYIYRINGNISITNPTNVSIQPFTIPLYLSTLDIKDINTSLDFFKGGKLVLAGIGPRTTVTIPYKIVGISTEWLNIGNKSILYNAITYFDSKVYSSLMGSLKKGPLEQFNVTGRNARIITARFDNPTGFRYFIDKVKIIKTPGVDITNELRVWNFPEDDEFDKTRTTLEPYETWVVDFLDKNASEGEVYWLTSDIYMKDLVFLQNHSIRLYDQDDLFIPFNDTNITENETDKIGLLSDRLFIRKFSSLQLINPTDVVNITLVVNNLEPHDVSIRIEDEILDGFKVVNLPPNSELIVRDNKTFILINANVSYSESRRIVYQVEYVDFESVGQDFFPSAELTYKNKSFYSQRVYFIRQYIPEKRVFVQKRLKYMEGDDVEVKLMVQNMGESKIEHLVLKEFLEASDEFKEISVAFENKGVWKIETLGQGEIWEVRYVTNQNTNLNSLPELYGVPKESILKTIILNNMVKTGFFTSAAKVIEYIGLTVVVVTGLIVILLQFKDSFKIGRKRKKIMGESGKIQKENISKLNTMLHDTKEHIEEPEPAPQPEPQPEPQPAPQPAPQPEPQPVPQPEPKPEQQPAQEPAQQPKPDGSFKDIQEKAHSKLKEHFDDLDDNEKNLDDLKKKI